MAIPGSKFGRVIRVGSRGASTADWSNILVTHWLEKTWSIFVDTRSNPPSNFTMSLERTYYVLHHKSISSATIFNRWSAILTRNNSWHHNDTEIWKGCYPYITYGPQGNMVNFNVHKDFPGDNGRIHGIMNDSEIKAITTPWDWTKFATPYGFSIEIDKFADGRTFIHVYEIFINHIAVIDIRRLVLYHRKTLDAPLLMYIPSQLRGPPFYWKTDRVEERKHRSLYNDGLIESIANYNLGPPITTPGLLTVPVPGVVYEP